MESLIGKDRPDKDAEAVILTKYIVSPDRGLDFIKAFKLVSSEEMPLSSVLGEDQCSARCLVWGIAILVKQFRPKCPCLVPTSERSRIITLVARESMHVVTGCPVCSSRTLLWSWTASQPSTPCLRPRRESLFFTITRLPLHVAHRMACTCPALLLKYCEQVSDSVMNS